VHFNGTWARDFEMRADARDEVPSRTAYLPSGYVRSCRLPLLPAVVAAQRTRKTIGARRTPLARSTARQGPRDRATTTTGRASARLKTARSPDGGPQCRREPHRDKSRPRRAGQRRAARRPPPARPVLRAVAGRNGRRDGEGRERRPDPLPNPHREPIWRNGLPVNPKGRIARRSMRSIGVMCSWLDGR
jgi:hypothetical protein